MKTIRYVVLAMVALMMGAEAHATFHLWRMAEIFSNADGSVQFLELTVQADGEGLITGHALTSTVGDNRRTFVFKTDLEFRTGGKTMLVATEGFAALGIVTPDFVVPNGFFPTSSGSVDFAGVDLWDISSLPTGLLSLARDGSRETNSPKNFAGVTGTYTGAPPPVSAFNVQALWWGAPAGNESGWGLNITHQGDILFATWFTYDMDGTGMWLVAPDARRTTGNTYAGSLYRTTGPAFSSTPFDSTRVAVTPVGSITLTFANASNGTFAYTVNGVAQAKAIVRQVYDAAVATCTAGGAAGAANYQDLWWVASESGWGVNITHQGNILFATWFTYDAAGRGMWLVMPDGRMSATGVYSGRLYRTTGPAFNSVPFTPATVGVTDVGLGTFTFSGSGAGTFAYTVNGITQAKSVTRQVYSAPATVCR